MRGDVGIHHEKLQVMRTLCTSGLATADTAGMRPDPQSIGTDIKSFQHNQVSYISDVTYPLVFSTLSSSLFPITLILDHNTTIITESKVKSSFSISPWHNQELTQSTAYNKYSIHEVQHTLSIASTQDCLSSHYSHDYELTHECCICCWCTSQHDRQLSAISQ
jgi:hypothetical protein